MSVAAAGLLGGNIISVADSDFETGLTGNWGTSNCTIAQSAAQAFTGSHSLAVTCTTTGDCNISYAAVKAFALQGYVLSGWALTPNSGRTLQLQESFFTSGFSFISNTGLTAQGLTAGTWTPLAGSFASPGTTGLISPIYYIRGMSGGETIYLDLLYCANSLWQVLAAWQSSPLASSPLWADMTPWVRADKSITYTSGRGDETSTVQAGSASFTLDNSQPGGYFAPGNANSPFAPNLQVGKKIQLNACDETGAWHNRFTGHLTSMAVGWEGGPGLESLTTVQAQDLLGWLARDNQLRTMIEEEQLYDAPECMYVLADPSGSTTASDSSGNAAPPLTLIEVGAATVKFGQGNGIIGYGAPGFSSSPLQCPTWAGAAAGTTAALQGYLPSPVSASAGFTAEIWYRGSTAVTCLFTLVNSRTREAVTVGLNGSSEVVIAHYTAANLSVTDSVAVTISPIGVLFLTVSGTTADLFWGDASQTTLTLPAGFTADYVVIGGLSPSASSALPWVGQLSCFAVYPAVLSTSRMLAHYTAGVEWNFGMKVSALVGNILRYEGIPSALQSIDAGFSYADGYEITGQTPLSVIQLYQQVDGGVFYVNPAGQLAWQDRTARYGAQVTPALTLQAGQFEPDLTFTTSTQFMIDDATFGGSLNIPGGVRALNSAAVAAAGTYPDGDPLSPVTGPWYTLPYASAAGVPGNTMPDADVLTDAADWQVNIYGTPVPRSPNLTIDLATQPSGTGTQVSRAAVYGAGIGSVIKLATLPASAPGGSRVNFLMAEGLTETFTRDDSGITWTLAFNTSPASYSAAWIAGDANMGVLDSTAVVGRGTDGGSVIGIEYVGPPYPVPTFSGALNGNGNVGANDMRGLAANVRSCVYPPCAVAQQVSLAQAIASGSGVDIQWDTLWYDTAGGWNLTQAKTAYTVQLPGLYQLMAVAVCPAGAAADLQLWLQQNNTKINQQEQVPGFAGTDAAAVTAQVQCAAGDTLKATVQQSSGSSQTLATTNGGAMLAILWIGT